VGEWRGVRRKENREEMRGNSRNIDMMIGNTRRRKRWLEETMGE
jgi:hypothetical protein